MMGQHEDRSAKWRIVAPPPLPSVVRPRASHRPKHVVRPMIHAPMLSNPRATKSSFNAGFPAIFIHYGVNGLKGARFEGPFAQCKSTDPEWILKALSWTSAVSVYGHRKTVNAKLGHLLYRSLPLRTRHLV